MKWLSLKQAADQLGIHPTTLRRWADNGDIPVYITPGGHRRFLDADVQAVLGGGPLNVQETKPERAWATRALLSTQERIRDNRSEMHWLQIFDEDKRAEQREVGKQLLALIMQHIALPEGDETLFVEAERIAERYADSCKSIGLTAAQGLEIIVFFRDNMTETALKLPQVATVDDDNRLRLLRKLNQIFNLLQIKLVEAYQEG